MTGAVAGRVGVLSERGVRGRRNHLQQDEATSHTANPVQEWGKRNMAGFWPKELWPPSSPDLNPLDFAIWSIPESKTCSSVHRGVGALGRGLGICWDGISGETVRTSCSRVPGGLRRIVGVGEGCIKK